MKVELTIDRTKELPKGAVPALEKELLKRLGNQYENCSLSIRRTGSDGLSVLGGDKEVLTTGFINYFGCYFYPVCMGEFK